MAEVPRKLYLVEEVGDKTGVLLPEDEKEEFDEHFNYEDISNDFERINCRIYYWNQL